MKKLQDTRYQLTKLGTDPKKNENDPKGNLYNGKNAELDKVVQDWRKQDAAHKKTMEKRIENFVSGILDVLSNHANKKQSRISSTLPPLGQESSMVANSGP